MNYESIILDIDGTLWDSRALVAEGFNLQLTEEGYPHLCVTVDDLTPLFGKVMQDLADTLLDPVFSLSGAVWFRWGIFLAGLLLLTVSCALMIRFCPGMSILDAIVTRLSEKLRISFRAVRMTIDAGLMVAGLLLGGVVGIGSVVAVLGTGPLIQFFVHFGKKG